MDFNTISIGMTREVVEYLNEVMKVLDNWPRSDSLNIALTEIPVVYHGEKIGALISLDGWWEFCPINTNDPLTD